jgi:hypothetical protein
MNQAQRNKQVVVADLETSPEARAVRDVVLAKVASWMPEGGHQEWGEELFFRLWLVFRERSFPLGVRGVLEFKKLVNDVLHPRFGVRPSRPVDFWGPCFWEPTIELGLPSRDWSISRTDDEFGELIEDWQEAIDRVRHPEKIYGEGQPLSEWILERMESGAIDWHRRDPDYWRGWFREVSDWRKVSFPPQPCPLTARAKARTWPFFLRIVAEKIGAADRHVPGVWVGNGREPTSAAQWLRRVRYLHRTVRDRPGAARGDNPVKDYGLLVGRALNKHMSQMVKDIGDSCVDNFRFARMDRAGDMRRYRIAKAGGCCGSFDRVVTILGKKYIIGCNYGH